MREKQPFPRFAAVICLLLSCAAGPLHAADVPSHASIHLQDLEGWAGEIKELTVRLDFAYDCDPEACAGRYIKAWSYALCHDPGVVRPVDCDVSADSYDFFARDTASLRDGRGPDFSSVTCEETDGKYGVAVGIVVSFSQTVTVPPKRNWQDTVIRYELQDSAIGCAEGCRSETSEAIWVCDKTVGMPPVDCVAVNENSESERFTQLSGGNVTVHCPSCNQDFFIAVTDGAGFPNGEAEVCVLLDFDHSSSDGVDYPVTGWSYGICTDPSIAAPIEAGIEQTATGAIEPEFYQIVLPDDIEPPCENGSGLSFTAVLSWEEEKTLEPQNDWIDLRIRYRLADAACDDSTEALPCDTVGCPPVPCAMHTVGNRTFPLAGYTPGTIRIVCDGAEFVRGDADGSGGLDIADAVRILEYLFEGGKQLANPDPADVNDDGLVSLTDAGYLLRFLFLNGPAPFPPYPASGVDPTADDR